MDKLEFYKEIYLQVLDYTDERFIYECAKWGIDTESKTIQNNLSDDLSTKEKTVSFIYALTTATIIGEFAKISFNDYLPEKAEIDLYDLEMNFNDIRHFLNKDTPKEHINILETGNIVDINDLSEVVVEYKDYIYKALSETYTKENKDPNVAIYTSLLGLFGSVDDCISLGSQLIAISYVKNKFIS